VEPADGLLEVVALDEPHGVEGAAVGVAAQAVDRHDARVLQPAGHLRLADEALPAVRVVGVPALDLLERHGADQLLILGHEHLAQATLRVRPKDPVSNDWC
jgi:hypothetical protein